MNLIDYATERQAEIIKAYEEHGSHRKAAKALGIGKSRVAEVLQVVSKRAAMSGYAPESSMTKTVPAPYIVKGVSTLYDKNGNVAAQWVKSQIDKDQAFQAIKEWIESLSKDIKGASRLVEVPKTSNTDLLAVYPIGDPHFGMFAWAEETGDDFDLKIAERLAMGAIDHLVSSAPDADTAIILELGDFFHADSNDARTPRSGNSLDTDTRWAKVMQVGLRSMIYTIQAAMKKHTNVIVRIVKGNHDPHSSFALALSLHAFFSNNPRVKVDLSPSPFWYYNFGNVLIGSTHGDGIKAQQLPLIMAADQHYLWGATKHRFFHCGHIHHDDKKEFPGCIVEYHRTLASRDAWHTAAGYRSGRDMKCIIYHKKYGERIRYTCNVDMIEDQDGNSA